MSSAAQKCSRVGCSPGSVLGRHYPQKWLSFRSAPTVERPEVAGTARSQPTPTAEVKLLGADGQACEAALARALQSTERALAGVGRSSLRRRHRACAHRGRACGGVGELAVAAAAQACSRLQLRRACLVRRGRDVAASSPGFDESYSCRNHPGSQRWIANPMQSRSCRVRCDHVPVRSWPLFRAEHEHS